MKVSQNENSKHEPEAVQTSNKITQFFCAFNDCGYTDYGEYYIDHDYHDYGYIMIGYLDINNKGNVYNNSSAATPVNSVRIVNSVHNTPAVTAGGKREEALEGDAVTVLGGRPIH
jgi:hypothetical protein